MKFGVVVFPGSSSDADCYHAIRNVVGAECDLLWHQATDVFRLRRLDPAWWFFLW
jgi:phosphoribosylformylglycinamidine (FGAM) synthase-like amidotransferase family enzyme